MKRIEAIVRHHRVEDVKNALAESKAEGFDSNPAQTRHQKVAEFVNENQ